MLADEPLCLPGSDQPFGFYFVICCICSHCCSFIASPRRCGNASWAQGSSSSEPWKIYKLCAHESRCSQPNPYCPLQNWRAGFFPRSRWSNWIAKGSGWELERVSAVHRCLQKLIILQFWEKTVFLLLLFYFIYFFCWPKRLWQTLSFVKGRRLCPSHIVCWVLGKPVEWATSSVQKEPQSIGGMSERTLKQGVAEIDAQLRRAAGESELEIQMRF